VATSDEKLDEILGRRQTRQKAPPRVWLTPEETAEYLGVARTRITRDIRGCHIPFHGNYTGKLWESLADSRGNDGWEAILMTECGSAAWTVRSVTDPTPISPSALRRDT